MQIMFDPKMLFVLTRCWSTRQVALGSMHLAMPYASALRQFSSLLHLSCCISSRSCFMAVSQPGCAYRHLFEERKYVEEYRVSDVEAELGLSQEALVRMALLLGSDYTEGVPGIGIVNALEVVRTLLPVCMQVAW